MGRNTSMYFKFLWQSVLFWAIAMSLFGIFRFYGLGNGDGIQIVAGFENIITPSKFLPMFMLAGVLIGLVFSTIGFLFEKYSSKRIPLGLDLLLQTFIYFVAIIAIATAVIELAGLLFGVTKDNERGWWRTDKGFWAIVVYVIIASIIFSFIKISNEKFGKGVFLKMLLGNYKNPKEENRIFMFLDLKASTSIAETLGHYKYSQLIQDCFYDINDIVPKYDAEIYQYVGDEVVLSWPYAKGLANKNCVALFFEFQRAMLAKAEFYNDKYGLMPEFKAGLHGGKLMVAEVGVVKKELAFHGDVINTSARIQSECNNFDVSILISKKLKGDLNVEDEYRTTSIGNILLKGKNKEIEIFTVSKL